MSKTILAPLLLSLVFGCGSTSNDGQSQPTPQAKTQSAPAKGTASIPAAQDTPLNIEVVTSVEEAGAVNSIILSGTTEAVVVDAQLTKSGAQQLAAAIEKTGKTLTTVFITHAHPDHFLGTAVLSRRFPNAKIVATADVVGELKNAMAPTAARMKGMLGPEFPGDPVMRTAIPETSILVDGQEIRLLPKLNGDTHPITGLYVEPLGVLLASDVAYGDVHLWTASTDHTGREAWAEQTRELEKLPGLKRVIPGHQLASTKQSTALLSYTRKYIGDFDRAVKAAKSSDDLIETMKRDYPVKGEMFLQMGASAAMGEGH